MKGIYLHCREKHLHRYVAELGRGRHEERQGPLGRHTAQWRAVKTQRPFEKLALAG